MLDLVVDSIINLTDRIRYLTLNSASGERLPSYTAGAHLEIMVAETEARAYSLIDFTPSEKKPDRYCIAVQREDSGKGGSLFIHSLEEGDQLRARQPKNSFMLADPSQCDAARASHPVILLAGGIGITPLISMAATLQQQEAAFHLHYSGRNLTSMAFVERLQALLAPHVSIYEDDGELPQLVLPALLKELDPHQMIYVCGPKGMIDSVKTLTEAEGINPDHIHYELFDSPSSGSSSGSGNSEFEIELQSSGKVFVVPPDKSIIDVLEAAGLDIIYDCLRGDCGICQTAVIDVEIDHRGVVLSSAERASGEVMQICVSRARSSRLVLDID